MRFNMNILTNDRKKLQLIIVIMFIIFIVIPVGILIIKKITTQPEKIINKIIIIDNKNDYSSSIDPAVFTNISISAYTATSFNIKDPVDNYHGIIRSGSFNNKQNKSVTFILDIPSTKMSWYVGQPLNNTGKPILDTAVDCVTQDQAIYPLLNSCIDQSSGNLTSKKIYLLRIAKILPLSGLAYKVTFADSSDFSTYVLIIEYFSLAGKQDALNDISSSGFNPNDYQIQYIDSTQE